MRYASQSALKRTFAVFLVVMGSFILYQNRGALVPHRAAEARPVPAAPNHGGDDR